MRWSRSGVVFFFFSSRRRHTRCSRDWSSDVCSSDLKIAVVANQQVKDEIVDARCFAAKILEQIEIRSAFAPDRIIGRDRWKVMRIWESSLRDPEAVMCKLSLKL